MIQVSKLSQKSEKKSQKLRIEKSGKKYRKQKKRGEVFK